MIEEYKEFIQELAVIKFISANMEKLVKGEIIFLVDITEDPQKHPHYSSRVVTTLRYDEEIGLIYKENRSGSPSCWNSYENDYQESIFNIAHWIVNDINAAQNCAEYENCEVECIEIEGM